MFQAHADKFGMMFIGLIAAGFICDVQWQALAKACGL